ncbi:MAG: DNA mismatch repair endonuclease MutL [Calditrichaeota bacterium]|nr:MAG: DNA mismatch repair endonuclease MutL [Calditrichota bacterium]
MSDEKIKILPVDVANKIAAGEVVERPASVVKEMVENAIDAGANEITIILKEGGKDLIQVADNGSGMSANDLKLAFERHATSKIISAEDLESIGTLGFRGEALASIASVARIETKSIEHGQTSGSELQLEGGFIVEEKPAGGTSGTTIAVKNIFFNTPARRKFLRATSTEYRRCLVMANRMALSFPEIQFTLVHNGVVIWEVKKQSMLDRVCTILGKRVKDKLIEINEDEGAVQISGVIGTAETLRKTSGEQYLFLNSRYITDRSLNHAVSSAYGEILHHGGYPLYVLNLSIDPARVDVNVHPTKMEVKFLDDRMIYSLLRGAVRRRLMSTHSIPDLGSPRRDTIQAAQQNRLSPGSMSQLPTDFSSNKDFLDPASMPITKQNFFSPPSRQEDRQQLHFDLPANKKDGFEPMPDTPDSGQSTMAFEKSNVFQLHKKYILSQTNSGLVIIDQHAAHERILYERALKNFENLQPHSQKLLFPKMIELSAEDFDTLQEMVSFLEKLGFMLGDFGKNTVVIDGIPARLRVKNYDSLLQNMIDDFRRGKRNNLEIRDNVAKTWACHGSIRSGDALTFEEINALIAQLFEADTPYFCPHGRPVIVKISVDELDIRFNRT